MSQHMFNTEYNDIPVSVIMGYARRVDGYFMVIEKILASGDPDYIYSSLFEKDPNPTSLALYQEKLAELDIEVPIQMLEEIISDRAHGVSTKFVIHSMKNGAYTRESTETKKESVE